MASLMPQGKQAYFDSNGDPLAGGKVYTYQAGTTTPLATYSDEAGATPNANPIILDARGEATIFWSTSSYKVKLTTSADVEIWTQDNLKSSANAANDLETRLAASSGSSLIGFLQSGSGAVSRTLQSKGRDSISIFDFMSSADRDAILAGTEVDITTAAASAHATGRPVFYPYGNYKHVGVFPSCEGGILGEGWTTNGGGKKTVLKFYNCTNTAVGAITPKATSPRANFFRIENLQIVASSWDGTTGCLGYGLDISDAPVILRNLYIQGFKKSNIFMHHDASSNGPYDSLIENVFSAFSGRHGCFVGNGANSLTFINYKGYWNGAASFGEAPYSGSAIADVTVTGITVATPAVITYSGTDRFANGERIVLNTQTGATLPTGLSGFTTYFVKNIDTTANTFEVATTYNGTSVNTTGGALAGTVYVERGYSGLYVAPEDDDGENGTTFATYTPENINIIGGDCSYNASYGWDLQFRSSTCVFPGYAEYNMRDKGKEVRVGNLRNTVVSFSQVRDGRSKFQNGQSFGVYFYTNEVYVNGGRVHPANDYDFIKNATADDLSALDVVQEAPSKLIYLSRTDDGSTGLTYFQTNATPDSTAVTDSTETVATLRGTGTYYLGIGSGTRHLRVSNDTVRLPDLWYQGTTTGWNPSAVVTRSMGTAAPVAGTWVRGSIVFDTNATAGGYIGWVCTTGGTPGTWKQFGAILP